jgi:hypothetical protein
LIPYIPQITAVLERTLRVVSKEGQQSAGRLLSHVIDSMVHIKPNEYRNVNYSFVEPITENLPVRVIIIECHAFNLSFLKLLFFRIGLSL